MELFIINYRARGTNKRSNVASQAFSIVHMKPFTWNLTTSSFSIGKKI